MIKSYRFKQKCRFCEKVVVNLTPEKSQEGRTYAYTCAECNSLNVEVRETSEGSKKACHFCKFFDEEGSKNPWYGTCRLGHIGDEDELQPLGLVYVHQTCSDFKKDPDGSPIQ